MLSSIHPLGERARHNRWVSTVSFYALGSAVGGVAVGSAMGGIGALSGPVARVLGDWTWPAVVAVMVSFGADGLRSGRRLPGPRRQVNEDWLVRYRGWAYGAGFGLQLGCGALTIVTTTTIYAWLFLAALTRSVAAGAIVGAVFGVVRAAPSFALWRVHRPDDIRRFHRSMQRLAVPTKRYTAVAMVGVVALVAAR